MTSPSLIFYDLHLVQTNALLLHFYETLLWHWYSQGFASHLDQVREHFCSQWLLTEVIHSLFPRLLYRFYITLDHPYSTYLDPYLDPRKQTWHRYKWVGSSYQPPLL